MISAQQISGKNFEGKYKCCLLYFRVREQKQWLIIENRFTVFQRSIHFSTRLNQLSKHFCHSDWGISKIYILNASFLQVSKNSFFLLWGIKRSLSVPSQADDSLSRCFRCSKMQLFEPMRESSHCCGEEWSVFGGWFSWFLGSQLANKSLCTTQNWLFCVVLVVWSRNV